MGAAILLTLVVLVAGLLFAIGLFGYGNPLLIGIGLVVLALCAIYGTMPNWPRRTSGLRDED